MRQIHLCISHHPQNIVHNKYLSQYVSQENKLSHLTEFMEGKLSVPSQVIGSSHKVKVIFAVLLVAGCSEKLPRKKDCSGKVGKQEDTDKAQEHFVVSI